MTTSLKFATEDFFLRMLRADPRLKGMKIVHADDEALAKTTSLIVESKVGNVNLAGPGGRDIEVSVEYRTGAKTTKAKNDLVISAIQEIYNSRLSQAVLQKMKKAAGLEFIVIKDETTSDQQNSQDLRKWVATFPLQAKLA